MNMMTKVTTMKREINKCSTIGLSHTSMLINTLRHAKFTFSTLDNVVFMSSVVGTVLFLRLHYIELGLQHNPLFNVISFLADSGMNLAIL